MMSYSSRQTLLCHVRSWRTQIHAAEEVVVFLPEYYEHAHEGKVGKRGTGEDARKTVPKRNGARNVAKVALCSSRSDDSS